MSFTRRRAAPVAAGMLVALASGAPLLADDTELFVFDGQALDVNPNLLLILDTSGSMDTEVESQQPFDAGTAYDGACAADRVYWRRGTGNPPACGTDRWFERSALRCAAALSAFDIAGGFLIDKVARYDEAGQRWQSLLDAPEGGVVECRADRGEHGDGSGAAVYAHDGDANAPWSDAAADEIDWSAIDDATLYSGNFLNWYHGPTNAATRMEVLQNVARGLAGSINGVNIGLMRFNGRDGGRLVHPVEDIATGRHALIDAIDSLDPSGMTPLSETLYEAALYLLGRPPQYGNGGIGVSDGVYRTPIEHSCQKSFIVYLTDGEPRDDSDADDAIVALPGFADTVGPSCDGSGEGRCLDDLAEYLFEADLSDLPGRQNAATYTIGFTLDLPLMSSTAQRGGGRYYTADDSATLSQALTNIVASILETQTTFTAPAVSIDNFSQTRHRNDLFVSVFQPVPNLQWPGNLKKYRLRAEDATIVDANGSPAIDPATGFFYDHARSWWSNGPDGSRVTIGGAANRLPPPDTRRLYTYLGGRNLTAAENAVSRSNGLLDEAALGLGDPDDPSRDDVIDFMRGLDVGDADGNGRTDEPRNRMGDPLHTQPVSLTYGGTSAQPDPDDALVFFATNDGYLHAIDPVTGIEQWAFVAPEFLRDQVDLLANLPSPAKHYGIDGNIRLQIVEQDGDGVIDSSSGDKAYLFFGMRRGGDVYYGLDVTDPASPRVLWRLDGNDLPGLGQTWSSPVPTRVDIESAGQNGDDLVLIFAGGYDTTQDNEAAGTDNVGNALYIVDSVTGDLLWHGGASGATRNFADMRYSMPADVRVIDLDGNGYADRLYAADMGGQVWRFDISNGEFASSLVSGGVIARLGSAGLDSPTAADTRRFYYAPDVALVSSGDLGSFLHIGIGSGYRAHPTSTATEDRFYALRDHNAFDPLSQADYDTLDPVTEADLVDVTDDIDEVVPHGASGWMLRLAEGEKVLSEARTFANEIYFTTFTPEAADPTGCEPRFGSNKLYIVSLFNGAPVNNLDFSVEDGEELTVADRSRDFQGSIASAVTFLFPSPEEPADPDDCIGEDCTAVRPPQPVACVDLFCFPTGFGNTPVRTYWTQKNVDR